MKPESEYYEFYKYLESRTKEKYFIFFDRIYTEADFADLIFIMKTFPKEEFAKCFEKSEIKSTYTLYLLCTDCEINSFYVNASKTSFTKYLRNTAREEEWLCADCQRDRKKKNKEKRKLEYESQNKNYTQQTQINTIEHTVFYIEHYLDPEKSWNSDQKHSDRFTAVAYNNYYLDKQILSKHIKSMPYRDFLKTPYWKAISWKCKQKADFKCQLCNGGDGLETHHRTYESHGLEHENLQDLIVLCRPCHAKFHDKEP